MATENTDPVPAVDTTPLNPTTSRERRDSLEKHLLNRPDEQDLKDRHILLDTSAAPALQAKQAELERQRVSDSLKRGLEKRPEKEVRIPFLPRVPCVAELNGQCKVVY